MLLVVSERAAPLKKLKKLLLKFKFRMTHSIESTKLVEKYVSTQEIYNKELIPLGDTKRIVCVFPSSKKILEVNNENISLSKRLPF